MSTIGGAIRAERERSGVTLVALAKAIGMSKSQLSLIESGKRSVTEARVTDMERALEISDGCLMAALRWDNTPPRVRAELTELSKRERESRRLAQKLRLMARTGQPPRRARAVLDELLQTGELRRWVEERAPNVDAPMPLGRQIPVINKVAAGYPAEFTDLDYPASIADEYIACPDVTDPDAFAARVVGASMEPEYRAGEIVVFSPLLPTPSGSDCFVRLERDNETTFKRIFFQDSGETIRLQPLNHDFSSRTVNREDIGGMYAAAYVMRRVDR